LREVVGFFRVVGGGDGAVNVASGSVGVAGAMGAGLA
jgi:hypothetical protein